MNTRKYNLKKIVCFLLIITCLLFICSCSNNKNNNDLVNYDYHVFPSEMEGIIKDKKVYVTSIGQDAEMIKFQLSTLEKQNLFEYTIDSFLDANTVLDDSVVFAFVGCSIKGLSESGTTLEEELDRANSFVNLYKNNKITLIVIHAGGNARRGSTSDSFIELMFSNSNFNIFVESGNFDNFLSDTSINNNVKCYQINNYLNMKDVVNKLYGDIK